MLKTILSVSGRPGLFKLISNTRNFIVVESLTEQRRMPVHTHEKVVSLADIAIYTNTEEKPLSEVLQLIKEKESGNKASISLKATPEELRTYLETILPDFDKERVYPSDIKKLISWYNILTEANINFTEQDNEQTESEAITPKTTSTETPKTKTPRTVKESSAKASSSAKTSTRTTRKKV